MKPELVQATTPLFIGAIGGILGISIIFSHGLTDAQWAAGIGLAGTAIAGASGLAQSSKSEKSTDP